MNDPETTPSEPQKGFFGTAVRRPVAFFVLFVTLIVIGVIAYARIPLEMIPEGMRGNGLQIWVENPGASAEENESKVVRVLEEQIRTLSGIDQVFSTAREDDARIEVIYEQDTDMDLAKAELRDRIERARPQLPSEIDRIYVWAWDDGSPPLMWFAILHEGHSERNDYLLDTVVQRRLEAVDGVSRVEIWGRLDDSVRILLDEEQVKAVQLDIGDVIRRLRQDNFTQPLGEVYDGGRKVLLRSDMRFKSLEEIERFPIGRGLILSDVGRVERVKSVRDRMSRIDGSVAYYGVLGEESTANVVETSRRVQEVFEQLEADPGLEGRFRFLPLFSQGDFIEASLKQMRDTALWGGALAGMVLFFFLRRFRLTFCVALAIPVSALLALTWEYFTGGSFNVLTMTGITLAIGMLVDNAVVVIENIARVHATGRPAREAAAEGARDVALAVSLATLTTVVVFLPMIFMAGDPRLRVIFGALGFPLCVSLMFSLLVALVFLPVVTARIVGPRPRPLEALARAVTPLARIPVRLTVLGLEGLRRAGFGLLRVAHRVQRGILKVATPLRWVLAAAVVALAAWRISALRVTSSTLLPLVESGAVARITPAAYALAAVVVVGLLLFGLKRWGARPARPPVHSGRGVPRANSFIDLMIASNAAVLGWTLRHRLLASFLAFLAFMSVNVPVNNMTITPFGQDEGRSQLDVRVALEDNFTLAEASEEMARYEDLLFENQERIGFDHLACRFRRTGGRVSLYWEQALTPEEMQEVREGLHELWPKVPGHKIRFYGEERIDTRNSSIVTFQLQGPDHEVLARLGSEAIERLERIPGLSGVSTELENAPKRIQVKMDPEQAWTMGVTADMALQNIAWALRGAPLPRYHEPGREIPFYIEYDEADVAGLDTLRDLDVFTMGGIVPLATFAQLEFREGPRAIFRRNGQTSFSILGRVDDPNRQREVSDAGYAALREMELPRGYSIGEEDLVAFRQMEEMREMQRALLLSVVLVFLLMGILFESVLLPFSVLFTIPFAVTGALWTLYLTGTEMDSVGWIGLIILVGVVVNNGIVLIDRIHRLRGSGLDRSQSVIEGGRSRVRPILMTAATTIFGLLPMATSAPPAEGIDYRALATCVAGGLAFSTFFTLWVVPLAYTVFDDLGHVLRRRGEYVAGLFRGRVARAELESGA